MHFSYGRDSFLEPVNFGIAFGIVFGLYALLIGLLATYVGFGANLVLMLSSWYIGYDTTLVGSFAGGLWGFVDSFIAGYVIALIYNLLLKIHR